MAFFSCSSNKTVFITNKLKSDITIKVDSNFKQVNSHDFIAVINGKSMGEKWKLEFGKGKWSKQDKADLEALLAHTQFIGDNDTALSTSSIDVRYIRLGVEELWVIINKAK